MTHQASNAPAGQSFGRVLRQWRTQRGWSQLELACQSNVSQRHISFLESGRSRPSRDMVLHLGAILTVPLRQQNVMLTAAGFAPLYSEHDLSAPELAPIQQALDFMLHQQEPYPALVLDRYWTLLQANSAANRLLAWLLGDRLTQQSMPINVLDVMISPQGLRPYLENWDEISPWLSHRLKARVDNIPGDQRHARSPAGANDLGANPISAVGSTVNGELPVLPVVFAKDGDRLSFFTLISTLGTPQDITLQELRVESLFPTDAETAQWMHRLREE